MSSTKCVLNISIPYKDKMIDGLVNHCFLRKSDLDAGKYWVVLTHGAGGDLKTPQLYAIASHLADHDFAVLRFTCKGLNIKYRITVFNEVINYLNKMYEPKGIFIGGRSMGARAAVMLLSDTKILNNLSISIKLMGIICLSYPLHKVNNTKDLRDEPLLKSQKPIFFLSGTNDEMCRKQIFENMLLAMKVSYKVHWLEGCDHSAKSSDNYQENMYLSAFTEISNWCLNICK